MTGDDAPSDPGASRDVEPVDPASRWCPSCGDEFEPMVRACDRCRVELVDRRPRSLEPVDPHADVPYAMRAAAFDLTDLDDDQYGHLLDLLDERPVPHGWGDEEKNLIIAYPGYVEDVELLVRAARALEWPGEMDGPALVGRLVPMERRLAALSVDVVLAAAPGALAWLAGAGTGVALVVFVMLHGLVQMRSPGKRAVGAGVLRRSGTRMSRSEWLVRTMVRDGGWIGLVLGVFGSTGPGDLWSSTPRAAAVVIGGVWSGAVLTTVLLDPHRRGAHDQIGDTAVYAIPLEGRPLLSTETPEIIG